MLAAVAVVISDFFRAEVINVISRMYGFSFGTRVILIRKVSLKKKYEVAL